MKKYIIIFIGSLLLSTLHLKAQEPITLSINGHFAGTNTTDNPSENQQVHKFTCNPPMDQVCIRLVIPNPPQYYQNPTDYLDAGTIAPGSYVLICTEGFPSMQVDGYFVNYSTLTDVSAPGSRDHIFTLSNN